MSLRTARSILALCGSAFCCCAGGCTADRIPVVVACVSDADCGGGGSCTEARICSSSNVGIASQLTPILPSGDAGLLPRGDAGPGADAGPAQADAARAPAPLVPLPLLLDDFEDLDPYPRDSRFAVWQHYSYNPSGQDVFSWSEGPGDASQVSMHLEWRVRDEANGMLDYPGAGLRTGASNVFVDLSQYTQLVLSHRYEAVEGECKPSTAFKVAVFCGEFNTDYAVSVPVSSDWSTAVLPLSSFREPEYLPASGVSLEECLRVADGINFTSEAELADGECAAGRLLLDTISLQ